MVTPVPSRLHHRGGDGFARPSPTLFALLRAVDAAWRAELLPGPESQPVKVRRDLVLLFHETVMRAGGDEWALGALSSLFATAFLDPSIAPVISVALETWLAAAPRESVERLLELARQGLEVTSENALRARLRVVKHTAGVAHE